MSEAENPEPVDTYLKALDVEELNILLGKVLGELRARETDEMQVDVVTKSQRLRLKNMTQ